MDVGNDLHFDPATFKKYTVRSAWDATDLLTRMDTQEYIFDYIFSRLGINTSTIDHPVLLTESVCNPNYCRKELSELLFECYGVPSVCYGIDAVFSYYYNNSNSFAGDSLIVSAGHKATYIIPYIDGHISTQGIKRLPIGGQHTTQLMHDLLHLKYPDHRSLLLPTRAEQLKEKHCYVAFDFHAELLRYRSDKAFAQRHVQCVRLYDIQGPPLASAEDLVKKQNRRREQGLRLKKILEERRIAKRDAQERELTELRDLLQLKMHDPTTFRHKLKDLGYGSDSALLEAIAKLETAIDPISKVPDSEKTDEELFPLLFVPDSQLSQEQIIVKQKQSLQKRMRDGRLRAKKNRDAARLAKEREQRESEAQRQLDPTKWIEQLQAKRKSLEGIIFQKRKRMESGEGAHKRQRAMAEAAFETTEKEDTFGADDADWEVYLTMTGENDEEDLRNKQKELDHIDGQLLQYGVTAIPTSVQSNCMGQQDPENLIYLANERTRVAELLFRPSLVGLHCMSLSDIAGYVLSGFPTSIQQSLAQNIFITGGSAQAQGFAARLAADVRAQQTWDSTVRVWKANDPILDTWRGMQQWCQNSSAAMLRDAFVTRAMYEEHGGAFLQEHAAANTSNYHGEQSEA
eukprot:TRINITY_DN3492_c0_g1_i2.p1 TRINITY_DN3492_c0_g1~~TRINITY_DN3492_c0_g1_i2.p1  ORF type:complete len:629 (+),score=92.71 TRINITY_DN3492_c0_g1_i2:482-2368(+)